MRLKISIFNKIMNFQSCLSLADSKCTVCLKKYHYTQRVKVKLLVTIYIYNVTHTQTYINYQTSIDTKFKKKVMHLCISPFMSQ